MNAHDKARIAAGAIALICIWICYIIISVVMIESAKSAPVHEPRGMYPEIPQCDKELWLRITEGCKDERSTTE